MTYIIEGRSVYYLIQDVRVLISTYPSLYEAREALRAILKAKEVNK